MFQHQALSFMIYLLTISLQARLPKKIREDKKKRHFLKHVIALIKDIMKLGFHWEVFSGFGLTITTYFPPWSHQLIEAWRNVLAAA